VWRNGTFSGGVPSFTRKGKLGLVELVGASLAYEQEAPFKLEKNNLGNSNFENKKEIFCFKGKINKKNCKIKIDTCSEVTLIKKGIVEFHENNFYSKKTFNLKYPTGEKVSVEFKIDALIKLGKFSINLPVYVVDMEYDCLLGTDFFSMVKFDEIFTSFFNISIKENGNLSKFQLVANVRCGGLNLRPQRPRIQYLPSKVHLI